MSKRIGAKFSTCEAEKGDLIGSSNISRGRKLESHGEIGGLLTDLENALHFAMVLDLGFGPQRNCLRYISWRGWLNDRCNLFIYSLEKRRRPDLAAH